MRGTYWLRDFTVIAIGLCAMLFLSGTDHKLNKAEQATAQDRLRVHCIDQPHDAVCLARRNP